MSATRSSYGETLTTDLSRVRFLLGDTDTSGQPGFSDEEITGALGMVPSNITTTPEKHYSAAAFCLDNMAVRASLEAGSIADPERSQDLTSRATELRELAASFRARAGSGSMPVAQVVSLKEPPSSPHYIETS